MNSYIRQYSFEAGQGTKTFQTHFGARLLGVMTVTGIPKVTVSERPDLPKVVREIVVVTNMSIAPRGKHNVGFLPFIGSYTLLSPAGSGHREYVYHAFDGGEEIVK